MKKWYKLLEQVKKLNKKSVKKCLCEGKEAEEIAKKIWREAKDNNLIYYNISRRGGGIGIYRKDLAELISKHFDIDVEWLAVRLPKYFGAGCNYLGGGVRGAIYPSDFDKSIYEEYPEIAEVLEEIADLAIEEYERIEEEILEEDEWSELATKEARKRGIISAY